MIKREENGDIAIICDAEGCDVHAPPAEKILAGHGLNNMGWECHGGTHLCPAHAHKSDVS